MNEEIDEDMENQGEEDSSSQVQVEARIERDLPNDIITIECNKLNGKHFNGTVNFSEAKVKIFQDGLVLSLSLFR